VLQFVVVASCPFTFPCRRYSNDTETPTLLGVVGGSQSSQRVPCGRSCMFNSFARRGAQTFASVVTSAMNKTAALGQDVALNATTMADVRTLSTMLAQAALRVFGSTGSNYAAFAANSTSDFYLVLKCQGRNAAVYHGCVAAGPSAEYALWLCDSLLFAHSTRAYTPHVLRAGLSCRCATSQCLDPHNGACFDWAVLALRVPWWRLKQIPTIRSSALGSRNRRVGWHLAASPPQSPVKCSSLQCS